MTKAEKERKEQLFRLFYDYINKTRHELEEKGYYDEKYWPVFAMAQQHVEFSPLSTLECEYNIWKESIEHD